VLEKLVLNKDPRFWVMGDISATVNRLQVSSGSYAKTVVSGFNNLAQDYVILEPHHPNRKNADWSLNFGRALSLGATGVALVTLALMFACRKER
jgi:hypothetical protein